MIGNDEFAIKQKNKLIYNKMAQFLYKNKI